jgi:hypothetical protein
MSDNKWHFVALVFDQTDSGFDALYIDGSLSISNGNGGNDWAWTTGEPLEIGYTSDAYFTNYNGALDDVRYYGAELTPSQISTIFASGNAGALADPADLLFQFNFTDAPGQGVILTWGDPSAVLQSAPTVTGPWTDVTGATSPQTIVPTATQQYFRYRYTPGTPQTWVSNPYLM